MANVGQSTPSTRDRDLPDPCGEKRELRRMVQERDKEIERLRETLEIVAQTTDPKVKYDDPVGVIHDLHYSVVDALDGGGDQS